LGHDMGDGTRKVQSMVSTFLLWTCKMKAPNISKSTSLWELKVSRCFEYLDQFLGIKFNLTLFFLWIT
jgi:hypothetical protein